MHHRSLGREELRRAGSLVFPNSNGTEQHGERSMNGGEGHTRSE